MTHQLTRAGRRTPVFTSYATCYRLVCPLPPDDLNPQVWFWLLGLIAIAMMILIIQVGIPESGVHPV
jgi:hypothetical protein